ncbi:MAG: hypothetical protein C0598_01255, partial [Marinilabiliales bacterium]
TGIPIAYNTPITIDENTNFISYYPDYTLDAEAAFASIKDVNALGYVRQWDGKMLRYLSALGEWDNQIGETEPGQGYIVYRSVQGTVDLVYPALPPMMNAKTYFNNDPVHFTKPIGNPDAAIFTFYLQGEDLEVGDEVAAFDGDKMVGATRIASLDDITGNPLNMFRGLEDGYNNGYTPGNPISLMIWKASSNKEYRVLYTILNENEQEGDQFAYAGEGFPEGDYKYSLVDITMPLSVNNNLVDFINIYPNPANNMVNINSPVKMERINIVNLLGQNVIDFTPDSGITEINLSSLDTGVYFINMFIDGNKLTKKLIIQ